MAVSHVKTSAIADKTGTVTFWDGATTASAAATDLIRPGNWNSVHNQFHTVSGNTSLSSTASGTNVVYSAAGAGLTLIGSSDSIVFTTPPIGSYYYNMPFVPNTSAIIATSGSSIWVQPFYLPEPVSASYLRLMASFNDSAVGTAGTTSANNTYSCERYTTIAAVIYSQGVGGNSRSLQSVTSSSGGITGRTIAAVGAAGYTITLQKTFMDRGNNTTSYTTSYATTSASIIISSNSNTLFTGLRFLDIPFGNSLQVGMYWLAIGASTSSNTNSSHISFCGTAAMPISIAGISQSNLSVGVLGAVTSASDNQLYIGAGMWSTNASKFSTDSMNIANISQVVSNPMIPFQLIRQA